MPEITYQQLGDYLKSLEPPGRREAGAAVYLIFGDEMLVENAFSDLLDCLMPAKHRSFGYDPLDGTTATAADVVERINTYGLTQGLKLVAWRDARLFRPASDRKQLLSSARSAFEDQQTRKAAGFFFRFLSRAKLSFEDVGRADRESGSVPGLSGGSEDDWVDELITYCRQNGLKPTVAEDQAISIKRAIEKGLPQRNYLVITTDAVDRRQGLFKLIREQGLAVDCTVPRGSRRADKQAQEKALIDTMDAILKPHRKRMDRVAYGALCEKTGFDLRTFANSLQILVNFVGPRGDISAADVAAVLRRTKQDPIYELTNAVSDRSLDEALFFLDSLLGADLHPLQILAALTNQIRRLLLARDFVESPYGKAWYDECAYNQFQTQVLPAMVAYDQQLLEELAGWQRELDSGPGAAAGKAARAQKRLPKKTGDLVVAKNPKNAYPLYLLLRKAGRFTKAELMRATQVLLDTDRHLKSSAKDPKLVLERLILRLCGVHPS